MLTMHKETDITDRFRIKDGHMQVQARITVFRSNGESYTAWRRANPRDHAKAEWRAKRPGEQW